MKKFYEKNGQKIKNEHYYKKSYSKLKILKMIKKSLKSLF